MSLNVGKILTGKEYAYKLVEKLQLNQTILYTAWKAEILGDSRYQRPAKWTATTNNQRWLKKEREAYDSENDFGGITGFEEAVQSHPYCLVLEHLDLPLSGLDPAKYKTDPGFMAALSEGMLGGVRDVGLTNNVWTDCKPDNVLCSNVDGRNPAVKISDLGFYQPDGYSRVQMQSPAMRAPEVWAGYGCCHVLDVYFVGSTILSWLEPGVLGPHDVKLPLFADAWCIAKMIKLVETENERAVDPPTGADSVTKSMYDLGQLLLTQPEENDDRSMHVPARPLREILLGLDTMPEVEALFHVLLAANFHNRLSAEQVLKLKEYKALQHAALSK